MHRPKGWDATEIAKPIKKGEQQGTWVSQLDVELVEAGADAFLTALRADGFHILEGQTLEIEGEKIKATKNQTLVLIPDD